MSAGQQLGALAGAAAARYAYKRWFKKKPRYRQSRLAKRLARLERGYGKELKTHDKASETTINTTGTIIPLSETAQGDTSLTREGLLIRARHLQYKIWTTIHASGTNTVVRVIIFRDSENHGAYPTAANLLEADSTIAWPEHDTRPRFKIYRDIIIDLASASNTGCFIRGIIKWKKNLKIDYSGTTAAEASNGKNALFAYIVSNEGTNVPAVNFYSRIRFTE